MHSLLLINVFKGKMKVRVQAEGRKKKRKGKKRERQKERGNWVVGERKRKGTFNGEEKDLES